MRKQLIEDAAYEVATQVRAVEDTIDAAVAQIAELQARIIRVNAVAGVSYGVIHPPLLQATAAVAALVESRGAIAACHEACVEAKSKIPGLRTVSWGDTEECPPASGAITPPLRVVA